MIKPTWQSDCGQVQLWLGDCREILPHLPKVDAVLTDPPYGIGFAAQPTNYQRAAGMTSESWDDCPADTKDLVAAFSKADTAIFWGGNYFSLPPSRCWLSWFKPDAPPSMGSVEYAWTSLDQNSRLITHSISATNAERVGHPTQKPERVMTWCLSFLPQAKTILDPYMGSGTVGISCLRTGRAYYGIEISPKYFEIAKERIQRELAQLKLNL